MSLLQVEEDTNNMLSSKEGIVDDRLRGTQAGPTWNESHVDKMALNYTKCLLTLGWNISNNFLRNMEGQNRCIFFVVLEIAPQYGQEETNIDFFQILWTYMFWHSLRMAMYYLSLSMFLIS